MNTKIKEITYNKILNYLSIKDRSEYEIRDKVKKYLLRSSISLNEKTSIEDYIVNQLYKLSLLDDLAYSRKYIQQKLNSIKTPSKLTLITFLTKKGISRETINSALDIYSPDVELQNAKELAVKKVRLLTKLGKKDLKTRLIRYLSSKKFSSSVIYSVIDTMEELK